MSRRRITTPPMTVFTTSCSTVSSVSRNMASTLDNPNNLASLGPSTTLQSEVSPSSTFSLPDLANPERLYQAYLQAQQQISTLKAEKQVLESELADAKLRFVSNSKKTRSTGKNRDTDAAMAVLLHEIEREGRYYQFFGSPFVENSAFTFARPGFASNNPIRYENPANQALGPTAELYEFVPEKFHWLMFSFTPQGLAQGTSKQFISSFIEHIGTSRSNAVKLLRRELASTIFGLKGEWFINEDTARDTIPAIQRLIGHSFAPISGEVQYSKFPPVLYRDGDTSQIQGRFLNEALFRIARAAIFGKTSVLSPKLAVLRSVSACFRKDEAAGTTYGLIAWAATMARYVLSKDSELNKSGVGPQTHINYRVDFEFYKRYLITAANNADSSALIDELFKIWDREIFENHNKKKGFLSDENEEVIPIDDADQELEQEMALLRLASAATEPAPEIPDDEDEDEMYYTADIQPDPTGPLSVPALAQPDDAHEDTLQREPISQSGYDSEDSIENNPTLLSLPHPPRAPPTPSLESQPTPGNSEDPVTISHSSQPCGRGRGRVSRGRGGRGSKKV